MTLNFALIFQMLRLVMDEPFSKWSAQVHVKKTAENFFITRFTLTIDQDVIVLLTKFQQNSKVNSGVLTPKKWRA